MQITTEELTALIKNNQSQQVQDQKLGKQIVVLDRGYIYIGDVEILNGHVLIHEAKNIRYWGTKNGLGELINGPLLKTKVDFVGEINARYTAVIHFIQCNQGW